MNQNEMIDKLKAEGVKWVMRIGNRYYLFDARLNRMGLTDDDLIAFLVLGGVHPKRPRALADIDEFREQEAVNNVP